MESFFGDGATGATFSDCRVYRYALWRRWTDSRVVDLDETDRGPDFSKMVAFIGLNPSTADETEDDPTIRRCIGFAKRWGFDGMCMLNLFALRATDPNEMKRHPDPVGPDNDECLRRGVHLFSKTVACWGVHGSHRNRHYGILGLFGLAQLWHLGLTQAKQPKHPLYLRSDTNLVRW
jgi:hypothetical protein